jgi:hypothetical protein
MYDEARKVFRDVAMKNLDWPEAVWEAWVNFEHVHGSVKELEDSLDRVDRARRQVSAKRARVSFFLHRLQYTKSHICARRLRKLRYKLCKLTLNSKPVCL